MSRWSMRRTFVVGRLTFTSSRILLVDTPESGAPPLRRPLPGAQRQEEPCRAPADPRTVH
jgi:hypothetical protein